MNIVQITPGAGGMYCGNCFRDNALVGGLRRLGHSTLMVPLYLPLTLDEPDNSAGTPAFFNGVNVYLEQKSALFRQAPHWLHEALASPKLLKWASARAGRTRAADLGEITLSVLQGEEGNQARELEELLAWLKLQPKPDIIFVSNALMIGLVRRLKSELCAPVVCMLQGEDTFLDALPESHRAACWKTVTARAAEADLFIAPSRYFGDRMRARLGLRAESVRVIHNGISLEGYPPPSSTEFRDVKSATPILGFFARMCHEKGLDLLVDAYVLVRERNRIPELKLRVGGGCGPADEPFVEAQRRKLQAAGVLGDVEFFPNLTRQAKIEFLRSLTLMSTPALYGEAFGLYVIEAMAAGVPVVQPRHAAFPELIEATGGGIICEPTPGGLAQTIEHMLHDPIALGSLAEAGRRAVFQKFSAEQMSEEYERVCLEMCGKSGP